MSHAPFQVKTPGRVNLIGEHTDYNGGLVLPMAIDRHVTLKVRPLPHGEVILRSEGWTGERRLKVSAPIEPEPGCWTNYLTGVIAEVQQRGWKVPGFELTVSSTLPSGGGLSSSAALEVGMATVLEELCSMKLGDRDKALLAQKVENEFVGMPCGIMDQFAVAAGRAGAALLLDCRSMEIRRVPVPEAVAVWVVNSGVKHALVDGEYAARRQQCESACRTFGVPSLRELDLEQWHERKVELPEIQRRRVRHVVTEHERTLRFVEAMEAGDWVAAGDAMYGSHDSLRDDYEVSCEEVDLLVDMAKGLDGVYGCRMTGGGFGGCVVGLVDPGLASSVLDQLREMYAEASGIQAEGFITPAVDGSRVHLLD